MPTENEQSGIDQSPRDDAIFGSEVTRTETGMVNKRTLSPVEPYQNTRHSGKRERGTHKNRIGLSSTDA